MSFLGILIVTIIFSWFFVWFLRKYERVKFLIDKIQGPTALPIIGNLHQFRLNPDEFFEQAQGVAYMFREQKGLRMARIWLGPLPFVIIFGAEESEPILSSNKVLHKLYHYSFLSAWIGDGLLISKPNKWRPRRKLLTPTFHYDILKDFMPIFNRHARTLCSKFDKLIGSEDFNDIFHTISLCTLDIICEAALGVNIDAQRTETDYLNAVFKIKRIIQDRIIRPQYYPEILFNLFGDGKEQKRCVKALHDFTGNAILARKQMMDKAGGIQKMLEKKAEDGGGIRLALLDLMLDMHSRNEIDLEGIQEEVDTFTFEGHDTTSAALNWFVHSMGHNQAIQAKLQQELDEVLGPDLDRDIAFDDFADLKYVDACLKETLRLYPSVPLIARQLTEDVKIKDFTLPAGTGAVIVASMVHRDTNYWENPEIFNPERFVNGDYLKHPYCYIPFSAGARNCIGQRFALMEEKTLVANIFRRFNVYPKLRTDQMRVASELIIRPMYGNYVKLERRKFGEYIGKK
uniref:Uncharacterized protein n=3 Tax=Meloidogyne TaxID=189290 RepID=A0A6V7WTL4_MELEN|nr:unnamed protein product [Meloidogyne enterolobii]CAD2190803.1 unnamed protein product [Meloidogyne enterolobii]